MTAVVLRCQADGRQPIQIGARQWHGRFLHPLDAAAGAGAVTYSRGQLRSVQETPFERAWDAAHDALRDLGFVVTYQEKEPDSAKLLARTKDNEEVEIRLKAAATTATEIRIRVGWLGNEALSNVVLDKIKQHL